MSHQLGFDSSLRAATPASGASKTVEKSVRWFPVRRLLQRAAGLAASAFLAASAAGQGASDYTYTDSGTAVTITGYTGAGGMLTIPGSIGGHPVTTIGDNAFSFKASLTGVTIPSGVTTIGESAFNGCSQLVSVSIPAGVTTIGARAFSSCAKLDSISLPNSVTSIGIWVFNGCRALSTFTFPTGLTSIPDSMFNDCAGLTSISIPSTITSIGLAAFHSCTSLASLTIPGSITVIPDSAFYGCRSLTTLTIPSSVNAIQAYAFGACTGLTRIVFMGNAPTATSNSFLDVTAPAFYQAGTTGWTTSFNGLTMAVFGAPTVTTQTSASITSTAATLGGNVTSDGGATVTARGVVYALTSANANPRLGGTGVTSVAGTGTTGVFTVSVSGLTGGGAYSYVAYATNSTGTSYSSVGTFTTTADAPTVTSPTSASITNTGATLGGNVTSDGGAAVTARGVVYALTSANANPRLGGTGVTSVAGTGTTGVFTVSVTGLTTGGAYSYVAYATNSTGTSYSSVGTFVTGADAPTITSPTSASITNTAATLGGNVTSDGGSPVTARGVVYAVNANVSSPRLGGANVTNAAATGTTGVFTVNVTGLQPGTVYSYAAYVTSGGGTSYTATSTFATANPPVLHTQTGYTDLTQTTAVLVGTVVSDGGGTLSSRGYVLALASTNSSPKIGGAGVIVVSASPPAVRGVFTVSATGLKPSSTYCYAAYAVNEYGATYSAVGSFTTKDPAFGDFTYVDDGSAVTITSYTGPAGVVTIPSTIGGHPVRALATNMSWANRSRITSVIIPEGVTTIGDYVFFVLDALESVQLPESLTTIGKYAFTGCTNLTAISIPTAVKTIGDYAFYHSGLKTVDLANCAVTSIGEGTFAGCFGLRTVVLPSGLKSIGKYAFEECDRLTRLTVPAGVTTLGEYIFYGCASLARIDFLGNAPTAAINTFYSGLVITKADAVLTTKAYYQIGTSGWTSPFSGLPMIALSGDFTFTDNGSAVTVTGYVGSGGVATIPGSISGHPVTALDSTFYGCDTLTSVTIPSSVTKIGASSFLGCSALTDVTIPTGVTTIGNSAFLGCTSLKSITIPAAVKTIEDGAFYGCTGLKTIAFLGNAPTPGLKSFDLVTAGGTYLPAATGWSSTYAGLTMTAVSLTPTVSAQPAGVSITQGQNATFTVSAGGTAPFSYQWKKDGVAIAGATDATLRLVNVTPDQAGTYSVVITNANGSITSNSAALAVSAAVTISSQPVSRSAAIGDNLTAAFSVSATATNGGTLSYQWRRNGINIAGASSATLNLPSVSATDFGTYTVLVTSSAGSTTSAPAKLSQLAVTISPPVITSDLLNVVINPGNSLVLTAPISTAGASYQWRLNGNPVPGATASVLVLTDVIPTQAGSYTVVASNEAGAVTSKPASVAITNGVGRQLNISTRGFVGTGGDILIPGFVISGTGPKRLLIRAGGPALTPYGVPGVLADPQLAVFKDSTQLLSNDNWSADATNSAAVSAAAKAAGAFDFAAGSKDAALVATLQPGSYTIKVSGVGDTSGTAIVEVYDLDDIATAKSRLINLATRALVKAGGDPLISGFVVQGAVAKSVLIRATGPALAAYNVSGTLAFPKLTLFDSSGTAIAQNAGWESAGISEQIINASISVGAFALTRGTADSALLITLPPGSYTAQVVGADAGSGVTLVEVYELP